LPKVGKYDYPFFDVEFCIEKLKQYHVVTKTDITPRQVVAEMLGMAMRGGGFAYLMASMEKYSLIHTGGGNVAITELGKTAVYGEPSEIEQAKSQAVWSVDLFRDLYEQYGGDVQLEQIKAFLRQKANVDIAVAQKMAPDVAKIYKKVSNYITSANKLERPSKESIMKAPSRGRREISIQPEDDKNEILKIQYGSLYIEASKEDAERALRAIADKLGIKLEVEKVA